MWAFLTRFKENDVIAKENEKMRKGKKAVEIELDDYKNKYIKILEEKGEGFNQFQKYLGLYEEYYNLAKENKKEIAELKADIRHNTNAIEYKDEIIAKLERKIKRLEKKVEVNKNESSEVCETEHSETSETDTKTE